MGNWYCNNCNSYKESWAENQFWKPTETYRRDIRCWSCNNWSLIYTDGQKARYKELVKEKTYLSAYSLYVEEVERFSTWWSSNIATAVVYRDGYYRVFLLVYDPAYSSSQSAIFPQNYDCNHWGEYSREKFSSPSSAKGEASWLRGRLISSDSEYYDNPILLTHPYCNCYRSFESFVKEPYVTKRDIPSGFSISIPLYFTISGRNYPSNPSSYLKPLDIVKVRCVDRIGDSDFAWTGGEYFYHVGVYLGKIDNEYKVCHFSKRINGTRVHSWERFLEGATGELIGYHPIVPFKNYDKVARQIAYAEEKRFREDCYSLKNRNCEHLANMLTYGINYSEQVEDRSTILKSGTNSRLFLGGLTLGVSILLTGAPELEINNGKGSTIKLTDEIRKTEDLLGYTWSGHERAKQIKEQYLQEVPPKEYCRIM